MQGEVRLFIRLGEKKDISDMVLKGFTGA